MSLPLPLALSLAQLTIHGSTDHANTSTQTHRHTRVHMHLYTNIHFSSRFPLALCSPRPFCHNLDQRARPLSLHPIPTPTSQNPLFNPHRSSLLRRINGRMYITHLLLLLLPLPRRPLCSLSSALPLFFLSVFLSFFLSSFFLYFLLTSRSLGLSTIRTIKARRN